MSNFVSTTALPIATPDILAKEVPADISVYVGAWVYLDATGTVQNAKADATATSLVFGLVESKPTTTTANVRLFGLSAAVLSGLTPGVQYFLSDSIAGAHTTVVPTAAGTVVAPIGEGYSADRMHVRIFMRMRRS